MKEIDFINAKLNRKDVPVPSFLYKYRPFDKHAIDMLENEYVFLCPAENLDDPSECKVEISFQDMYDLEKDQLKFKCIEMLLDFCEPYTTEDSFQELKNLVSRMTTPTGMIKRNFLLESAFKIQELAPELDSAQLISFLGGISEIVDKPDVQKNLEKLLALAYDARRDMGICSFSELQNSDEMWKNYANDSKGYCIEYDTRGYENLYSLFPVVYQDGRETNILTNTINSLFGEIIYGMSNGQIKPDKSHYIRMFVTKDLKWSYQKEWRLLGDAKEKLPAPSIQAIYLGKNMPEHDKRQLTKYCEGNNITVKQSNEN